MMVAISGMQFKIPDGLIVIKQQSDTPILVRLVECARLIPKDIFLNIKTH